MLTAFDVGVAVLVLISAILATARGFTREILSLATWVGAAAIAAYLYFYQPELLKPYFAEELIAKIVLVGAGFLVSLIVLHLITMRIADFVVDSRVGPLDRTLGFIFGVARGGLIAVVLVIFLSWLVLNNSQTSTNPSFSWLSDSKSLPILRNFGDSLIAVLPPDLEKQVTDILHKGAGTNDEASPEESPTTPPSDIPDNSTDLPEDSSPPAATKT